MKKLHWKIILITSTLFLLAPYAGEFGNLKVKADETVQTETSSSSSEQASTVKSSQSASTEQSQSSTEQAHAPSQTAQSSSAQEQTKTSTTSQQSQSGTLSGMIDQMFPAPTKAKPSATIEYVNGGVKFNNKFYTEAEFAKYIEKNFVPNPQVQFHVDASGKIVIDSQTRIASTMNWPDIGGAAAKGAVAIGSLGGASILASAGAALLIGGGLTVGYDLLFPHKVGGDIKATPAMIAAMARHGKNPGNKNSEHTSNARKSTQNKHQNRQDSTKNKNRQKPTYKPKNNLRKGK